MNASILRSAALLAAIALTTVACSAASVITTPKSFDRPGRASLVCFDVTVSPPVAVALARCAPLDATVGTLPTGLELHALVLQSRRGEIAVVDLRTNRILDTNRTIPGYTFVEAGALPVDLVSSRGLTAGRAITTYVANSGTEDLWAFSTSAFRATTVGADPQRVPLLAAPAAVALTPDERFLVVALPTLGVLRQFSIADDGSIVLTDPDPAKLPRDIPLAADILEPLTAEPEAPLYHRECTDATLALPTTAPPRTARSEGTAPYPVALLVDETSHELLVADAALPVVHRFAIDAVTGLGAEGPALAVGSPVRDLALTPLVPSTVEQVAPADRRYLYALDDTGAVAVLDVSDPTAFPNGRPLSIEIPTARSQDRITFVAPATSLTVVTTRDYDPADPKPFCVDGRAAETNGPTRLHGVFLAASLTDGTVRFVDVYDRDAACRGSAGLCSVTTTAAANDAVFYLRRHRPRVGALVSNEVGVIGSPTMNLDGVSYAVDATGRASSSAVPSLAGLTECAPLGTSFAQAYPRTDAAPLVCGLGDPWAATQERWTAVYEGTILSGAAGRFDGASAFIAGATDFCRAGVIGTNGASGLVVPGDVVVAQGDQLVITGDLPPSTTAPMEPCARLVAIDSATGERPTIAFEIVEANDTGTLTIGDRTLDGAFTREQVAHCFPELVTFAVRSRGSWVVSGSYSGLVRALPTTSGVCRVPEATPENAGLGFRAYAGAPFVSRALAFQIVVDPAVPATHGMSLVFDLGGLPVSLGVDLSPSPYVGSNPVEVFYSPIENRLYAVDAGRASLSRITLDNVSIERFFQ